MKKPKGHLWATFLKGITLLLPGAGKSPQLPVEERNRGMKLPYKD